MNILQVQDRLKGLSEQQLAQEMQMPSGMAPQFLVLSELQRRKRVRDEFQSEKAKGPTSTVAQDAVASAGVPQAPMAQMATAMAPQTDIAQNTGIASLPTAPSPEPQRMAGGGVVRKMQEGRVVRNGTVYILQPDGSYLPEAAAPAPVISGAPNRRDAFNAARAEDGSNTLANVVDAPLTALSDFGGALAGRTTEEQQRIEAARAAADSAPMGPPMPTEEERAAMAAASAEDTAPPAQDTTSSSSGGGAGGGAGGPMTSYEQALVDALARADKRATQDKWLAMAQAGLALMTSKQPTLGGALGEAGLAGIDQYRGSRDEAEKTKMDLLAAQYQTEMDKQQMALARAKLAAGGGGGGGRTPIGMLTKLAADRDAIAAALEALPPVEEDGWFFSGSDPAAAERQALTDRLRLADQALTMGYAQYGYPYLGGISSLPEDEEANLADE